jgi:regulator of RNase E activity RraA
VLVRLRPLNRTCKPFAGRAFTMRFIPAREDVDTYETLTTSPNEDNLRWVGVGQVQARRGRYHR